MGAVLAIFAVVFLMMLGVPVVFSFASMTLVLSFMYDVDISSLMTTGFWSVNSIILTALPLFVMTGYLMQSGGLARRLVEFVESLVGRSRSGASDFGSKGRHGVGRGLVIRGQMRAVSVASAARATITILV